MTKGINKEIIVLGDIEIGGGTEGDDFIADKALSDLITDLAKKKNPIDLVFNGDTFDFVKCPFLVESKQTYPRHITEEVSLGKLDLMVSAHKRVFTAMRTFCKGKNKNIYFIIGNHDHDLFFPAVRRKLRDLLGSKSKIKFRMSYKKHRVYIEHGQQYDVIHRINTKRLFLQYKGKKILWFPWTSFSLMSGFVHQKKIHPFLDRITPRPVLLSQHRRALHKTVWNMTSYFLKSTIYYPLRYYSDPTFKLPPYFFPELIRRMRTNNWDVDNVVPNLKKNRKGRMHKYKLYVLGHIHERYLEEKEGWTVIHPDCWRDEYVLDSDTKVIQAKSKNYVRIVVGEDISWDLVTVPIKRSVWSFSEVIKDEWKYIEKAMYEEGFKILKK